MDNYKELQQRIISQLATQNIDLKRRRTVNASPSKDLNDYVIKQELDILRKELIDNIAHATTTVIDGTSDVTVNSVSIPGTSISNSDYKGAILNIKEFGAIGNGVADDTIPIQTAANTGRCVYFPAGIYKCGIVNLTERTQFIGDGHNTIIEALNTTQAYIFKIQGTGWDVPGTVRIHFVRIANMLLYAPSANSTTAVYINYGNHVWMDDVSIDGFGINLFYDNCEALVFNRVRCQHANHTTAVDSRNLVGQCSDGSSGPYYSGWVWFTDCEFNQCSGDWSIEVRDTASIQFRNCQIVGNYNGGAYLYQTASAVNKITGVYFDNCDVDSNRGYGIKIFWAKNVVIDGTWVSSGRELTAHGIWMLQCDDSVISNAQLFWCGNNGIYLDTCTEIQVIGTTVNACRQVAFRFYNCIYCVLMASNGCNQYEVYGPGQGYNQVYGLFEDGGSDWNQFIGNVFNGNTGLDVNYTGAHTIFIGQLNNGTALQCDLRGAFFYAGNVSSSGFTQVVGLIKTGDVFISTHQVKTLTSGFIGSLNLRSTEGSGYSEAAFAYKGGASQAVRHLDIQTQEDGTGGEGFITFQAAGGRFLIGTSTDDGTNKVQINGNTYLNGNLTITGTITGGGLSLPLTTLGDTLYEDASPTPARLAGNTTATKKFLSQTGTGSVSAAPAWATVVTGDLPALAPISVAVTGRNSSVAATNLRFTGSVVAVPAGLYQVTVYITYTAATGANVTPTITWTDSASNAVSVTTATATGLTGTGTAWGTVTAETNGSTDLKFSIPIGAGTATFNYRIVVIQLA